MWDLESFLVIVAIVAKMITMRTWQACQGCLGGRIQVTERVY